MDRAEARAVEAAPTATTKRRTRRGRAAALGVAALIAGAASVPVGMVEIGTRRAAACLASYEGPREPVRPVCGPLMDWLVLPSRVPLLPAARYRAEELGARIPMAEYRDAAVGKPDREGLALGAEGMLAGERLLATGSQRPVLWDLGRAVGAPDLGRDAAELGDHRTLASRGEAWLAWPVRLAALHAALDEGDVPRTVELAKRYAGWDPRDEDLRAAVAAALCLGDEPSHGMRLLETLQDDRAKRKYAGMSRNFGDVRELLVACAARAHVPPPPKPSDGEAGRGDLVEARTVLRLRISAQGGDTAGSIPETIDAATQLLEAAPRSARSRLHLLAGLVELAAAAKRELPSTTLVRLATVRAEVGDEPLVPSPVVTTLDLLDEAPGLVAVLPAPTLAAAADRLEASSKGEGLAETGAAQLRTAAGATFLEAARAFAQTGDARGAARAIDRAGALVLPSAAARSLAHASALRSGGEDAEALDELDRARTAADAAPADDVAAHAVRAAIHLEAAEVLASLGRPADAAGRAAIAVAEAGKVAEVALGARARYTLLAIGRGASGAPTEVAAGREAWPWVGFADRASTWKRPDPARLATLDAALAGWQHALAAPAARRLALRYEAILHRGDAPRWLVAHLALGAGLLAGAPGDAEVWLDAFAALDARRFTHRTYAWSRAEAARWRGDRAAAELWASRLRSLRSIAADPTRTEIARFLGI